MTGWPITACNRQPWLLNMETTTDKTQVTCKNCLQRLEIVSRAQPYAGEMIPTVEIEHWDELPRQYRFNYCRRNHQTAGLYNWRWYQFSREHRKLLINEMRRAGVTAWALGIPGIKAQPHHDDSLVDLLKTARKITRAVQSGKQPADHLNRVDEILNRVGRAVAGGDL